MSHKNMSTRIKETVMKGYVSDCCKKKINIKRGNPTYGYSWSAICSKCDEPCKPMKNVSHKEYYVNQNEVR